MPKDYSKKNPRILKYDVLSYIASNSSLTQQQVGECFDTYAKMLEEVFCSKYIEETMTIPLLQVGTFYLKERRGRRKGSTYTLPITNKKKGEIKTIILDKNEPTTYKLSFKPQKTLNDKIRMARNKEDNE